MVLGTAQFGMDYGISNVSGKPSKKKVFDILSLAWDKGVRRFDTAPGYGSEKLLGEFISVNGLQDEAILLTKIPSLVGSDDFEHSIETSLELSLKNLGCPIDVVFFHNPVDSHLLLKNSQFFENLISNYKVSTLGVSVYQTEEVNRFLDSCFEPAFQFPFNVLDRRFGQVSMFQGKRYARSVFLQGLLASAKGLRFNAPVELLNLQKEYHDILTGHNLEPISFAVSYVANKDSVDYLLIGIDSKKQLQEILDLKLNKLNDISILDVILEKTSNKWFDPRNWS